MQFTLSRASEGEAPLNVLASVACIDSTAGSTIEDMATITIRNIDEDTKRKLQLRAALNGRSMEAEARELIKQHANEEPADFRPEGGLGTAIHRRFAKLGGVELEIPPRTFSNRPIPKFD
jgi:antitoxin FitA